jgi:lipid-A-disaccharide synthase-like uncharacterized protein
MDITTLIGTTGASIILIAFFLNQIKRLNTEDISYDVANFMGGLLLLIYAILLKSTPFAVLNGVWTLISLRDILMRKK